LSAPSINGVLDAMPGFVAVNGVLRVGNRECRLTCLAGWLTGWLARWLAGWLAGQSHRERFKAV
jgi:hypothetical protein